MLHIYNGVGRTHGGVRKWVLPGVDDVDVQFRHVTADVCDTLSGIHLIGRIVRRPQEPSRCNDRLAH